MKILFFGNQGNTCYRYARWLKSRGHEVRLYLPQSSTSRSLPEWETPDLKNNYPEWIEKIHVSKIHYLRMPRSLIKEAKYYDLICTTGVHVINALMLPKPVLFIPVGGDMTELPFNKRKLRDQVLSYLFRKRIKRVKTIIVVQNDVISSADLLGVSGKLVSFPMLVDIKQIERDIDEDLLKDLNGRYQNYKYVFVLPSRKNMDESSPDYKGCDKFLKAFKNFIDKHRDLNIKVIAGMHGNDVEEFRQMIVSQNIEKYFDYIEHLPLNRLHAYLKINNAYIFNSFNKNIKDALGGITRETLALGSVLIDKADIDSRQFISSYGHDCPVLKAHNEDEITMQMEKIVCMNQDESEMLRKRGREWAYKYLHWENRIEEFETILAEAAGLK